MRKKKVIIIVSVFVFLFVFGSSILIYNAHRQIRERIFTTKALEIGNDGNPLGQSFLNDKQNEVVVTSLNFIYPKYSLVYTRYKLSNTQN